MRYAVTSCTGVEMCVGRERGEEQGGMVDWHLLQVPEGRKGGGCLIRGIGGACVADPSGAFFARKRHISPLSGWE